MKGLCNSAMLRSRVRHNPYQPGRAGKKCMTPHHPPCVPHQHPHGFSKIFIDSAEALCLEACRCLTVQQTLQTPQTSKQAHKGESLPSPYPLPDPFSQLVVWPVTILRLPVTPPKNAFKINEKSTFSLFGPIKPAYIPNTPASYLTFDVYMP